MSLMAGIPMDAEVAAICGAKCRERSEKRVNSRNGHRQRRPRSSGGELALAGKNGFL
ncbi:MAG: transposase [Actinobacteria bacterium]|nr:transposase [Actinomycetota bacterium]